jgi:hypothetical protein
MIVTDGFVADPVRWQISTFFSYWYCAAGGVPPEKLNAAKPPRPTTSADASRPLRRFLPLGALRHEREVCPRFPVRRVLHHGFAEVAPRGLDLPL